MEKKSVNIGKDVAFTANIAVRWLDSFNVLSRWLVLPDGLRISVADHFIWSSCYESGCLKYDTVSPDGERLKWYL